MDTAVLVVVVSLVVSLVSLVVVSLVSLVVVVFISLYYKLLTIQQLCSDCILTFDWYSYYWLLVTRHCVDIYIT